MLSRRVDSMAFFNVSIMEAFVSERVKTNYKGYHLSRSFHSN